MRRTFWHAIWDLATGDIAFSIALFALALCWLLLLLVPQAPSNPLAIGQWLIRVESRLGPLTDPLRTLGLFSLLDSPFYRVLLAMLAFLLLVRAAAWAEQLWRNRDVGRGSGQWLPVKGRSMDEAARWLARRGYRTRRTVKGHVLQADRWPWAELAGFLAHVGPLLLLAGLLVGEIWGWRVDGVVGSSDERISVPGHGEIALMETAVGPQANQPGVRVYIEGLGPELTLSATDTEGRPLGLQRAPDEPVLPSLRFRLTEEEPDAYFAIPEAGLIVRIVPDPETALEPEGPLRVQVFRSLSGQLVWEENLGGQAADLAFEGVRVRLQRGSYPMLAIAYDPGHWLKAIALVITGLAMLGWGLWPTRRLWLRVDQGQPVGAGDLPGEWTGEGKRGLAVARAAVGTASALVAWAGFWSLGRTGGLWSGSTLQMMVTVVTTLGLGGLLIRSAGERGKEGSRSEQ